MTVACVTGASGFIGGALVERLTGSGVRILPAHRGDGLSFFPRLRRRLADLSQSFDGSGLPYERQDWEWPHDADWRLRGRGQDRPRSISELPRRSQADLARCLAGTDTVYHLAGLHGGSRHVTAADFAAVNGELTRRLFRAACEAGVRTFVWLSTIKVLGEVAEAPLAADAPHAPVGDYATSKARAERALLDASRRSTRLVIVRAPLVYGPGVGGNFSALMRLCGTGLPLPLAGATAVRSMVGLANLVDLLAHLPRADLRAAEILHVRDPQDWRTTDLVGELQRLSGRSSRQFPVSGKLAESVSGRLGMGHLFRRLFLPLRVDGESAERRAGWKPPRTSTDLLEETVAWARRKR